MPRAGPACSAAGTACPSSRSRRMSRARCPRSRGSRAGPSRPMSMRLSLRPSSTIPARMRVRAAKRKPGASGPSSQVRTAGNCATRMPRPTDAVSTGTAGSTACSANATPTASAAATRPGMARTGTARDRMGAVRAGCGHRTRLPETRQHPRPIPALLNPVSRSFCPDRLFRPMHRCRSVRFSLKRVSDARREALSQGGAVAGQAPVLARCCRGGASRGWS